MLLDQQKWVGILQLPLNPLPKPSHDALAEVGVMITASHNPEKDNGASAMWGSGQLEFITTVEVTLKIVNLVREMGPNSAVVS